MKPIDRRALKRIRLDNLLSFGPGTEALELQCLNIFIGPNSAGKSNLIDALSLMRATPASATGSSTDLRGVLRRGGGTSEWIWKGARDGSATVDLVIRNPGGKQPLRHLLSFGNDEQGFLLEDERIL